MATAQPKAPKGNAIQIICPFWHNGTWVFDDADKGLDKEPFVGGSDQIISALVANVGIKDPEKGFKMIFSGGEFPGYQLAADWLEEGDGGNWYRVRGLDMEGWLCPALFKYFEEAPKTLYARVEDLSPC